MQDLHSGIFQQPLMQAVSTKSCSKHDDILSNCLSDVGNPISVFASLSQIPSAERERDVQ